MASWINLVTCYNWWLKFEASLTTASSFLGQSAQGYGITGTNNVLCRIDISCRSMLLFWTKTRKGLTTCILAGSLSSPLQNSLRQTPALSQECTLFRIPRDWNSIIYRFLACSCLYFLEDTPWLLLTWSLISFSSRTKHIVWTCLHTHTYTQACACTHTHICTHRDTHI